MGPSSSTTHLGSAINTNALCGWSQHQQQFISLLWPGRESLLTQYQECIATDSWTKLVFETYGGSELFGLSCRKYSTRQEIETIQQK